MTPYQNIPIGELIRREFEKMPRTCTVTWFAKLLHCDRTNIYDIFSRQSIDTNLLMRISCILGHDFFADYSAQFARTAAQWAHDNSELASAFSDGTGVHRGRSRKAKANGSNADGISAAAAEDDSARIDGKIGLRS